MNLEDSGINLDFESEYHQTQAKYRYENRLEDTRQNESQIDFDEDSNTSLQASRTGSCKNSTKDICNASSLDNILPPLGVNPESQEDKKSPIIENNFVSVTDKSSDTNSFISKDELDHLQCQDSKIKPSSDTASKKPSAESHLDTSASTVELPSDLPILPSNMQSDKNEPQFQQSQLAVDALSQSEEVSSDQNASIKNMPLGKNESPSQETEKDVNPLPLKEEMPSDRSASPSNIESDKNEPEFQNIEKQEALKSSLGVKLRKKKKLSKGDSGVAQGDNCILKGITKYDLECSKSTNDVKTNAKKDNKANIEIPKDDFKCELGEFNIDTQLLENVSTAALQKRDKMQVDLESQQNTEDWNYDNSDEISISLPYLQK